MTIYGVIILEEYRTVASLLRNVAFATTKDIVKKGISLPTIYYHHKITVLPTEDVAFSFRPKCKNKISIQ